MEKPLISRIVVLVVMVGWMLALLAPAQSSGQLLLEKDLGRNGLGFCNEQLRGEVFARTELLFGRSKPDGSVVTDAEWQDFVDQVITPRFPAGLTALLGTGRFRDESGVLIREDSVLVLLLYPALDNGSSEKVEQIRLAYKRSFQQQSVLRLDATACVAF
jgi:Protein of unknown function (DUF3574)